MKLESFQHPKEDPNSALKTKDSWEKQRNQGMKNFGQDLVYLDDPHLDKLNQFLTIVI